MGIEFFERAAESRGRLLRVERRVPAGAEQDATLGIAYVLTFDVGRIGVGFDPRRGVLDIAHEGDVESPSQGLQDLAEEEPWWRMIGNTICAAWPVIAGTAAARGDDLHGIRIQFREDDDNPKLIVLSAGAGGVQVSVQQKQQEKQQEQQQEKHEEKEDGG